jgi:regulator of ribosome biosynthesis
MSTDIEFNRTLDIGSLTVFDTNNVELELNEDTIVNSTKENLKVLFSSLYKLKTTQIGNDDEDRDYDKPENAITLPTPTTQLPRALPIPKTDKVMTKWEQFSKDKGISKKTKRSRMLWSEEFGKYVPRWGKGSLKQEKDKATWVIEDKPKYAGKDPFTYEKQERQLKKLKQEQREEKNEIMLTKKRDKSSKLKNDKKGQRKNLEIAQKSTASLGRFDKKLKNEPKINTLKKTKVSKGVLLDKSQEKQRDSKIMSRIIGK